MSKLRVSREAKTQSWNTSLKLHPLLNLPTRNPSPPHAGGLHGTATTQSQSPQQTALRCKTTLVTSLPCKHTTIVVHSVSTSLQSNHSSTTDSPFLEYDTMKPKPQLQVPPSRPRALEAHKQSPRTSFARPPQTAQPQSVHIHSSIISPPQTPNHCMPHSAPAPHQTEQSCHTRSTPHVKQDSLVGKAPRLLPDSSSSNRSCGQTPAASSAKRPLRF